MKSKLLAQIINAKQKGKKLLAVLLDPDKLEILQLKQIIIKINKSPVTHVFIGGSTVKNGQTEKIVTEVKKHTRLPIVLFPGDKSQITNIADGILFLSLLSGNNPEFLIEQQMQSVSVLKKTNLEIIPTGYILIDGGIITAVQKISKTKPIPQNQLELIVNTALVAQYLGKQLVYLEAGSGATDSIEIKNINAVSKAIKIPLIVGGGLRSWSAIKKAYKAGADLVVVGTAFENNESFFEK